MKQIQKRLQKLILFGILAFSTWIFTSLAQALTPQELPSTEHPLLLYSNQTDDDLTRLFESAFDKAERSILVSIYALKDARIVGKLRQRAADGLDVTVFYDVKASDGIAQKLGARVHAVPREAVGLMHQKIVVIDDRQVWIGSANLTTSSLKVHGNLVMGFESDEMAAEVKRHLLAEFAASHPRSSHNYSIGLQEVELYMLPSDSAAPERVIQLIDTAKKTVRVAMYTWTHPQLTDALIRAHQRGVLVEAVMDRQASESSNKGVGRRLKKGGVPIGASTGSGLLHHKFAWIDGKTLAHGSANWTRAAFGKNDEVVVVVSDLSKAQQAKLKKLWRVVQAESKPLSQ